MLRPYEKCCLFAMSRHSPYTVAMIWINRIFGPPHELLHLLALWLIGRRAVGFSWTHVDIPNDLSVSEYIFVAGLPALVFGIIAAVGGLTLIHAPSLGEAVIGFAVLMIGMFAVFGTAGDIQLIIMRLNE